MPPFVGARLTYVGAHLSYVAAHLSYVGAHLSYVAAYLSYVGAHLSYVGAHLPYVGEYLSYVGAHLSYCAYLYLRLSFLLNEIYDWEHLLIFPHEVFSPIVDAIAHVDAIASERVRL